MASLNTYTSKEHKDPASVPLELSKVEIACNDMVTFMNVFSKLGTALRLGATYYQTWPALHALANLLALTPTAKFPASHMQAVLDTVRAMHTKSDGTFDKNDGGFVQDCESVAARAVHEGEGRADRAPAASAKASARTRAAAKKKTAGSGAAAEEEEEPESSSSDEDTNGEHALEAATRVLSSTRLGGGTAMSATSASLALSAFNTVARNVLDAGVKKLLLLESMITRVNQEVKSPVVNQVYEQVFNAARVPQSVTDAMDSVERAWNYAPRLRVFFHVLRETYLRGTTTSKEQLAVVDKISKLNPSKGGGVPQLVADFDGLMDQLAGHGGSLPPEVQAQRLLDAAGRGTGLLKEAHIETEKFFASKRAEAATANPPTPPPALEREKVINLLELYYKEAKNKKGDGGGDGSGGGSGSHKGKQSSGAGNGPDATANGAFGKGKGKGRGRG